MSPILIFILVIVVVLIVSVFAFHTAVNSIRNEDKLTKVFSILGYEEVKQLHQKHVLVSAISSFAGVANDYELESACNAELDKLKAEIQAEQNQ